MSSALDSQDLLRESQDVPGGASKERPSGLSAVALSLFRQSVPGIGLSGASRIPGL